MLDGRKKFKTNGFVTFWQKGKKALPKKNWLVLPSR
ncbi:hypothetical protein HBH1_01215 [Herbaspirillum sp. BH-1]|nr:hypothetical protein HBH1_01215 [Herbaspirillum sp. BH-1]